MVSRQFIIRHLVEEAMATGRPLEDVCRETPELLFEVRQLWQEANAVAAQVDALFPASDAHIRSADAVADNEASFEVSLPAIPGYEVQGVIGFGGMGVVYKARHLILNRTVAIKMPIAGSFATVVERQRHVREAQAAAALDHPNIIKVHDVGEFEGRPYFTMEFIDGPDLSHSVANNPRSTTECARLVAMLADAVHCGHRTGITHRDLKPANILLTSDGIPKIADFGLARHHATGNTLTLPGMHFGTPSYMPPEQIRGRESDNPASIDIYSLGAILYELLTGQPPFRGDTAMETLREVLHDEPTPPTRIKPAIPRDLETICLTCIAKFPSQRYASSADLAADLRRFLNGEPILARPTTALERSAKWVRRRPALAAASICLALLLGVVATTTIWRLSERAASERAADLDLLEAGRLQRDSAWLEAKTAIDRASLRLAGGGSDGARQRLRQAIGNSALADRFESVLLTRVDSITGLYNKSLLSERYMTLFRNAGIFQASNESADVIAARICASPLQNLLLDAIDMWSVVVTDEQLKELLCEVGERVDPLPQRRQLNRLQRPSQKAIDELVASIDATRQRPMMYVAFARKLRESGMNVVPLLTAVQVAHQNDFWVNFSLADALCEGNPAEAIRYYQVAVALRPNASVVRNNFANSLAKSLRLKEAKREYSTALALDRDNGWIAINLAYVLLSLGEDDGALTLAHETFDKQHNKAGACIVIGEIMMRRNQPEEAMEWFRKAVDDPVVGNDAWRKLWHYLARADRLEEAKQAWSEQLQRDPKLHDYWNGYAELCLYLGDVAAYRQTCEQLVLRFGDDPDRGISERTGRTCLLLPPSAAMLARVNGMIERAIALEASAPGSREHMRYYRVAGALAAYRSGDYRRALTLLDSSTIQVHGPMPMLLIAMSQHQLGNEQDARDAFRKAIGLYHWQSPATCDAWMYHILRREAESMLEPDNSPDTATTQKALKNPTR